MLCSAFRQQCAAVLRVVERRGGGASREGPVRRVRKPRVSTLRRRSSSAPEVAAPIAKPVAAARLEPRLAARRGPPGACPAPHGAAHRTVHASLNARHLRAARRGPLAPATPRAPRRPPAANARRPARLPARQRASHLSRCMFSINTVLRTRNYAYITCFFCSCRVRDAHSTVFILLLSLIFFIC